MEPRYRIATCTSRESCIEHKNPTWPNLVRKLTSAAVTGEKYADYLSMGKSEQLEIKDIGGFVAGPMKGFQRRVQQQEARSMLTLDLDEVDATLEDAEERIRDALSDLTYCVHTTHKHSFDHPRLRVVIPLSREVDRIEHEALARSLAWAIDKRMYWVDRCSFDYCRLMFWPSMAKDGEFKAWHNDAQVLPVDAYLHGYDNYQDCTEWPRRENESAHIPADDREDPRTKRGVLGIFCNLFDIVRTLDELLPGIYIEEDNGRYHFAGGTTYGGARTYATADGFVAFLHSEHDSDPAHGQHNAWDLVCKHRSYSQAEMEAFARELPEVAAAIEAQVHDEFTPVESEATDGRPGRYDWLKPWLYVQSTGVYYHTEHGFHVGAGNFDAIHGLDAVKVSGKNKRGTATLTASEIAMVQFGVQQVRGLVYRPGGPVVSIEDGQPYANSYRDDSVPAIDGGPDSVAVKLFRAHLQNILPNVNDQAKLLDWLAHVVRFPADRLKYAVLLRGAESDGKTILAELLRFLVGPSNWGLVGNDEIGEKYSQWMEHARVVCIEEIKQHGQDAQDTLNRLKPKITNPHISMRAMRQDSRVVDNYANLFLTTNHMDALPLLEGDSRFMVLSTRFSSRTEVDAWAAEFQAAHGFDFLPTLWRTMLTPQGAGEIRQWLEDRPFSEWYQPDRRAPDTLAKRTMVDAARTDADQALEEILKADETATVNSDFIVWAHFVSAAVNMQFEIGASLTGRGIANFMNRHGYFRSFRIMEDKERYHVWVKNPKFASGNENVLSKTGELIVRKSIRLYKRDQ